MGAATVTLRPGAGDPRRTRFDIQLLVYAAALVVFGAVVGYSASFGGVRPAEGPPQAAKTVIWAAIGFTLFFVAANVDYRWLRRLAVPVYLVAVGLLVLTRIAGTSTFGAQLSMTVLGIDFQFSEIAKVLVVASLAAFLVERRARVAGPWTVVGGTAIVGVPTALVLAQPDLGTAVVYGAILVGMLFLAGAGVGWLAAMLAAAAAVTPAVLGLLRDYQRDRLLCFVDPWLDPQGACYQVVQSLDAVGAGGLLGRGLSVGAVDSGARVPVQTTDFVFTVVAEDLGFAGGVALLALFGLLLWRVILIGWQAADPFGALVAGGVASIILFQLAVNVGMVLGVMPVTGIPLPFVTYGGSSLISLLFALGVVESVRAQTARPDL